MLYLDSIVVHNFKSFKHTSVRFKNGFNCIVGPNGSGKSNVVDAILFALGESSLRRMRISKMGQLINAGAKKRDDGTKRAYVKLVFSGDSNVEISRIIKSNGKVGYKINGKNATRQEVVDFLRTYKSSSDETNVIAQGEINRMQNMNPRERRELIDIAAGIREFDDKKGASMKELDKVDARIREAQIEVGMKRGFVSELEKQKEDAESFLSFKDYVTRGNYTILKAREVEVSNQFEGANRDIKAIDERIAKINGELLKLEGVISKLSSDKAVHLKELNEKSIETGSATRRMEEVAREIAVKDAQTRSIRDHVKEREAELDSRINELGELKIKLNRGEDEINRIKEVLKSRKAADKGMEKIAQLAAQGGTNALLELYSKTQKELAALQEKLSSASSAVLTLGMEIQGFEREAQGVANELIISRDESELNSRKLADFRKASESLAKEVETARKRVASQVEVADSSRKRIDGIDSKILAFKEQLAMSGASSNTRADDELRRALKSGFHGRAQELCTYDDKYDLAVNAAAASRMNYFVVDSAETAARAIDILKEKQLGRAAFIPLNDIIVTDRPPNSKLDALISHVRFDDRFAKAFAYIFADTYVVDGIGDAKKAGFGKGRFVTYGGELVDSSGIISGGHSGGKRMSSAALQSKVRALEKEREEAAGALKASGPGGDAAKRALSEIEAKLLGNSFEMQRADESFKTLRARSEGLMKREKELKAQAETASSKRKDALEEETKLTKEVERLRRSADETLRRSKSIEGSENKEREVAEYRAAMEEMEQLKIKLAETKKETDMQSQRSSQIESGIAEVKSQVKEDQRKLAILDQEITDLSKAKVELNEEIKVKGAKHGSILSKMNETDSAIAKATEQKGRHTAEMNKAEREVSEINVKKAQSQQRLSDIRNELAGYQNVEPIIGEEVKQIEERVARSKFEIEKLGAVNLKAPEVYREKSEELVRAEEKMAVLGSEKEAILNLIKEIDARKLSVFNDTFNQVNDSFKRLHDYIFGGKALLQLDSGRDPLEAGLNIVVEEGRNKNMHIEQFSGGEKALLVLILLFSIQMRKPQSFYLFDEIDAALDKENAKKLSKLLSELSKNSQLIVVSHNDTMITSADTAIGVVRRAGESAVVGLQMSGGAAATEAGA
jgi:chromosome segregation protein